MRFSLGDISSKGSSLISGARNKLPIRLQGRNKYETAIDSAVKSQSTERTHIKNITPYKDGSYINNEIKIPNSLNTQGLENFLNKTNAQLKQMEKEEKEFKQTGQDKRTLYISDGKIKSVTTTKRSKILPFVSDTSQTSIKNPSSEKTEFLKSNNIQKSKDRLGRTKLSFKATINGTEYKLYIPKEHHSDSEEILASKQRIENFIKKIENNSSEAEGYCIKNGRIFKNSSEEYEYTYRPNGIESDDVTETAQREVYKQVK